MILLFFFLILGLYKYAYHTLSDWQQQTDRFQKKTTYKTYNMYTAIQ